MSLRLVRITAVVVGALLLSRAAYAVFMLRTWPELDASLVAHALGRNAPTVIASTLIAAALRRPREIIPTAALVGALMTLADLVGAQLHFSGQLAGLAQTGEAIGWLLLWITHVSAWLLVLGALYVVFALVRRPHRPVA